MNWLKRLFSRRQLYSELSDEIQAHLDEKVEELLADGMSREDAIHAARREFGNVQLIEENSREVWGWPSVEGILLDIHQGVRALSHSPVFTAVALLTIAIGIGANAAVFSVVNSVLLKPLSYPHAEQLVALHQRGPHGGRAHRVAATISHDTVGDSHRTARVMNLRLFVQAACDVGVNASRGAPV